MKTVPYIDELLYPDQEVLSWYINSTIQKNPELVLIEKETSQSRDEFREEMLKKVREKFREEMLKKMRAIIYKKFKNILTDKEREYMEKLFFKIDRDYKPGQENQYYAAKKLGVTREYFGLIIHRLYKKIKSNEELKQECIEELRKWEIRRLKKLKEDLLAIGE